nr:hypothetical protein [Tanacetum cinerariifolium]
MLNPELELLPALSSPTISSISSSDLDTESTGSFFHDRSTTLGTLMGVTSTITFRAPSRRDLTLGSSTPITTNSAGITFSRRRRRNNGGACDHAPEWRRKRLKRRRWWWLCSGEDLKPSSLGEFLEVERRFGEEAVFDGEMTGEIGGGVLFADGRVLPPSRGVDQSDDSMSSVCSICPFSVSFAGICS